MNIHAEFQGHVQIMFYTMCDSNTRLATLLLLTKNNFGSGAFLKHLSNLTVQNPDLSKVIESKLLSIQLNCHTHLTDTYCLPTSGSIENKSMSSQSSFIIGWVWLREMVLHVCGFHGQINLKVHTHLGSTILYRIENFIATCLLITHPLTEKLVQHNSAM